MTNYEVYMQMATEAAMESIEKGGGPFGAVIVDKNGVVLACEHNQVVPTHDPTAHAEVVCIRNACKKIECFSLHGCTLFTTCEPCSMCLSACYWARLDKIIYGNSRKDAQMIGFDDAFIYDEVAKPISERKLPISQYGHEFTIKSFDRWKNKDDKVAY